MHNALTLRMLKFMLLLGTRSRDGIGEEIENYCTLMLGVAVVFIVLLLICLIALLIVICYHWRKWKKIKEDHESQIKYVCIISTYNSVW